jgi:hypothetical protein
MRVVNSLNESSNWKRFIPPGDSKRFAMRSRKVSQLFDKSKRLGHWQLSAVMPHIPTVKYDRTSKNIWQPCALI